MHDSRPRDKRHLGGMANQAIRERALRMAGSRMHDEAGGLIDDQQLRIFKNNRKVHRLSQPGLGLGHLWDRNPQPLALSHHLAGLQGGPLVKL